MRFCIRSQCLLPKSSLQASGSWTSSTTIILSGAVLAKLIPDVHSSMLVSHSKDIYARARNNRRRPRNGRIRQCNKHNASSGRVYGCFILDLETTAATEFDLADKYRRMWQEIVSNNTGTTLHTGDDF